jgi:geranylgeranyl reductase family protein
VRVHDVIVVGAGPAGAAVAARLHQHGVRDVLVLERYGFPRDKPCGGGLTGHADEALAALDLELRVPHVPSRIAHVRCGSFDREVELGRPVNVIRREDFDADLVAQVRARGVEIVEGEAVDAIAPDRDGVTIKTDTRELRAKIVIGADGAASIVRKHLIGDRAMPHRLFMRELPRPASASKTDAMLYDFTPMARGVRGYLWVFPVAGDRVNVGIMHYPAFRRGGPQLLDVLRARLGELGYELPARGNKGWPVWGYHPRARVSSGRLLTVGDAAGIDGLTGEGIAVAMEQAQVAGDHAARALREGDFAFAGYRRALRRAVVGRELALDRWLARLLYDSRRWRSWLSLVLYDPTVLAMYAARVDGTSVLADQKLRLWSALVRHVGASRARRKLLAAALPEGSPYSSSSSGISSFTTSSS